MEFLDLITAIPTTGHEYAKKEQYYPNTCRAYTEKETLLINKL